VSLVAVLWPDVLTASGAIGAWQEAAVSSEVSGASLVEVIVDVGDQVEQGQLLARFDTAPLQAAYAQQEAAVKEAQARLAEAEANASRIRQLRVAQAVSEFDLIKATTAVQSAQAQVESAGARLQSQRLSLGHAWVTAPDAGTIAVRNAMLGAVPVPGAELFRLVRQNRLEWRAEVTAADLRVVRAGQVAELRLPDGVVVSGTVRQVAPTVDAGTRSGMAYVALDPRATGVRVGMFASGTLVLGERIGMALPVSAIVERDGFEYVFRLENSDSLHVLQVKVTSGRQLDGYVEILEGLSADELVVKSGGEFLSDGDTVRVVSLKASREEAAAS
jgi:RND family efflux transporter MFP subunit